MKGLISEFSTIWPLFSMCRSVQRRLQKINFALQNKEYWNKPVNYKLLNAHRRYLEELLARLGKNSLVQQAMMEARGLRSAEDLVEYHFGFRFEAGGRSLETEEKRILELLKDQGDKARKNERAALIKLEILEKLRRNWYIVFNTLTIAPGMERSVFHTSSYAWQNYIRDLSNSCKKEGYGKSSAKVPRDQYHTFCAVVERGKNGTRRLHIHVLHFLKYLPVGSRDPNFGRNYANRSEIDAFKKYWRYGNSVPEAVRWSNSDAFARLGWRWPVVMNKETNRYERKKPNTVEEISIYLSKYATKDQKGVGRWRSRMSKGFGRTQMKMIAMLLTTTQLEILINLKVSSRYLMRNSLTLPQRYLKLELMKEWLRRKLRKKGSTLMLQNTGVTEEGRSFLMQLRERRSYREKGLISSHSIVNNINSDLPTLKETDICEIDEAFEIVMQEYVDSNSVFGAGRA